MKNNKNKKKNNPIASAAVPHHEIEKMKTELAAQVDQRVNADAVDAIEKLGRQIEIMDAGWRRSLLHKASATLIVAFIANCICLVVFLFAIQNFYNWKSEVEELSAMQVKHSGELVKILLDTNWIQIQKIFINETLERSRDQLENLAKLKIWYENHKSKLEVKKDGKGNTRTRKKKSKRTSKPNTR
jgi:preprotein translocase subunit SecG